MKVTPVVEKRADRRSPDQRSAAPKSAEGEASPHPHADALFALLSQIGGNIDIDELRTERIMAKHLKHLK